MSFYAFGLDWESEDFLVGSALAMPAVAPWSIPYYVRSGSTLTKQEAIVGLWSGIAWGALSKGGSLFLNAQSSKLLLRSLPVLAAGEAIYQVGKGYVRSAEHQGIGSPSASGFGLSPTQAIGLLDMTWSDFF